MISLIMLAIVLIGVTIVEPVTEAFDWLMPLMPFIVITGFFVFLVATSLFVYVIIGNLKKQD